MKRAKFMIGIVMVTIITSTVIPAVAGITQTIGPIVATEDAEIDEDSGDYNSGGSWITTGWTWVFFVFTHRRILLKFDFDNPLDNVTSLDISLYMNMWIPLGFRVGKSYAFDVYVMANTWSESTVTWNTKPSIEQKIGTEVAGIAASGSDNTLHVIINPGTAVEGKETLTLMLYLVDKGIDYMDWISCSSTEVGSNPPTIKVSYDDGIKAFNIIDWILGLITAFISFIAGLFGLASIRSRKKLREIHPVSKL